MVPVVRQVRPDHLASKVIKVCEESREILAQWALLESEAHQAPPELRANREMMGVMESQVLGAASDQWDHVEQEECQACLDPKDIGDSADYQDLRANKESQVTRVQTEVQDQPVLQVLSDHEAKLEREDVTGNQDFRVCAVSTVLLAHLVLRALLGARAAPASPELRVAREIVVNQASRERRACRVQLV